MDMYRGTVVETLFPELLDVVNSIRTASDEEWKTHRYLLRFVEIHRRTDPVCV